MRVAIVHYWLVGMRGGEKVVESLCRMYPEADIYTHCLNREELSPLLRDMRIKTTFIDKLPFSQKFYQYYLPLMPLALENLRLRGYDLVISSESGPAKGVIVPATTPHLCYVHTPMRYLWDFSEEYLETRNKVIGPVMRCLLHRLRQWDVTSSFRVDRYVANSACVARRVARWWGRAATVVNPPVEIPGQNEVSLTPPAADAPYAFFGQLVSYKRCDLAIRACHMLGRPLVVGGDGQDRKQLETLARSLGARVTFLGHLAGNTAKWRFLHACRALLFPGEEDFGIVPLEAMACGRPVIGYGRGGLLDSVRDGVDGVHFHEQTPDALAAAMRLFEERSYNMASLRDRAQLFTEERFRQQMSGEIAAVLTGHRSPFCQE